MKKFLNIAVILIAALIILGTFAMLPATFRVIWLGLFIAVWLCRKLIQDNLIAFLQVPDNCKKHPWLKPILWMANKRKGNEDDKTEQEYTVNEESIKAIRHIVSSLIYFLFVGAPLFIYMLFASIAGWFATRFKEIGIIFADLTGANGIGYIFFAVLMIAMAIATIIGIIWCFRRWYSYPLADGGQKRYLWIMAAIIVVAHVLSYIYFEYTGSMIFSDIFGHLIRYGILGFIYWLFRLKLKARWPWLP